MLLGVSLTCFVIRVMLGLLGNKQTFHTWNYGASEAITPRNWGIRDIGESACVFSSVSKGQRLPHPGDEHELLGYREEEGFSGGGLELMAELTDNQKNTGEHSWTLAGPRGVH